ncbi:(Na+)-NQR maturation NqrM [Psychromonas antarctica]|nr:(Na+)-NQR maturation NqrM [Psychromonas antarctica]
MTFFVFLLVVVAMAVGVIFGRKRIQGSCGGLATVGIDKSCDCETVCDQDQSLYQISEPTVRDQ